ncbi:MAG: PAS domain S-box protein [Vicinamibacteria bacterium]|jgi:PAS domain S-box-containing protein|nr:PAS domain S-box protein [Vicinamibacteria bacterium]
MSESLREALAKLGMFRAASDAILTVRADGGEILALNPRTASLFAFPEVDLVGRPPGLLFEDGELPHGWQDGAPVETLARKADGEVFTVELVATPFELAGEAVCWLALRDITERKLDEATLRESESRFRVAVETLGEGLIITDAFDTITYVNSRMAQLTDRTPDEMIGRTVEELLIPEDELADYRERMELRLQGLSEEYELQVKKKGGDTFWAEISASPFRDQSGAVAGTLGAVMDISERKKIQEELVAAVDAAEDASRAKSAFLANMSHELRTPLNAIIGYSEMLAEEMKDRELDDLLPDLDKVYAAGKHLLSLINDILDLSKIEAGKMDFVLEEFSVQELVRELQGAVQPMAQKAGNQLEVACADTVPRMKADMMRVRQILLNLLSNANKFTEKGRVGLRVEEVLVGRAAGLAFHVTDTGIGISPEAMERLFQPFMQADYTSTRKYGGTGLGLTICRQLAHKMGGDVTVASELGHGSTFTIVLPLRVGESMERAVERAERADAPTQTTMFPGKRLISPGPPTVLVVDDDGLVRDLLQRFLTKEGFRVATAADGHEALRKARELRPTLITLDVVMPGGKDGWQVLEELKNDAELEPIPVIMMTIVDNPKRGFDLGASDYVTKPIDWRRLGAAIASYKPVTVQKA